MKMTAEHYNILKARLDEQIQAIGVDRVKEHRAKKMGKDIEMRFRWDVYSAAQGFTILFPIKTECGDVLLQKIGDWYSDNQINTALKHYFKMTTLLN